MAKLFIGCDYIHFRYADAAYQGILSKIILDQKTIFRVDYTSQNDNQTGRVEFNCIVDPVSGEMHWYPASNTFPELTRLLQTQIQKNEPLLRLEN